MDSQFGLINLWTQGDLVTKAVAVLLLGMSLASWIVIIIKALDLRSYAAQARRIRKLLARADFADGLNKLGNDPANPFRALALEGREATAHHQRQAAAARLAGRERLAHAHAAQLASTNPPRACRSGLAVLASVGSTAPFIGLFGTVWGIYHALMTISTAGQATIDKVAGPIGEALIMTALGLAVAIPAVLGYNALVRGNKFVLTKLNSFAHDLHAYFVTGARVSASGADAKVVPHEEGS